MSKFQEGLILDSCVHVVTKSCYPGIYVLPRDNDTDREVNSEGRQLWECGVKDAFTKMLMKG